MQMFHYSVIILEFIELKWICHKMILEPGTAVEASTVTDLDKSISIQYILNWIWKITMGFELIHFLSTQLGFLCHMKNRIISHHFFQSTKLEEIFLTIWLQQGYNARKVNCSCVYSAYILNCSLWADIANKNRCISVRLVSEKNKSIEFW